MSELEKNDEIQEENKGKPISELRVCELKAELDKRGLSSAGVKAVLTARLNKALRDEGINTDEHRFAVARTPTASPMKGRPKRGKEVEEKKAEQEQEMEHEERAVDSSPEPEDSQGLRIVDDSFELREHEEQLKIEKEPEIVEQKGAEPEEQKEQKEPEPEIQELEEHGEEIQEQKEPEQKIDIDASEKMEQEEKKEEKIEEKNEEKTEEEDEEVEGEDEFEEVEEQKEPEPKNSEPKDSEHKEQSADELDLEEEELLEDPLDEVVEPKSTTKEMTTSMSTTNSESNSSLFGDEAKKTSIWIRGMSPSTKASSVKQLASQFGKVIQSKIFNSKPINGEIKNCFALVIFAEPESMENAIRALHRKEHDGRVVRVEKVADSNLTGSAERVAKERKEQTEKEQEETRRQEMRKKRAVILAPEEPKPRSKPARQTIQAPEPSARKNRAIIEAPARSRSRERNEKRARKPITYEHEEDSKRSKRETSHDSRRTIAAPAARGARVISPPPRSSSHRHHEHPSLIISARVDTSGCRGGGPIKRSVERSVPNNISTSELRRKIAPAPPRSGFSRTRVDFPPDDEHYGGRSQPPARQDYEYSRHHQEQRSHRYQEEPIVYQDNRRSDRENREREKQREREMIETYRRKEQEHRLREEKLQIEREREKMRFEQEKLERAKLELELTKQKLALQQATFASRAPSSSSSSRRRDDSAAPRAKMHTEDRKRRDGEVKMNNRIPSARHVAAEYGIQANLGNSSSSMHTSPARGATLNNSYGSPSKNYERYRSNYEASNYQQGYQQQQRYEGNNYQQQMWAGLDSSTGGGQMTMETHWTGDSSASSSATSVGWQHQNQNHQNNQYSNNQSSSSSNRRDYGYTRGHY